MAGKSPQQLQAEYELAVEKQKQLNALALEKAKQENSIDIDKAMALAQLQEGQNLAKLGANRRETGIPMLDAFDVYLTQERANNPFSIASQAIRKTALPKSDNVWENLGGNLLQGLGGGLFQGLGEMGVQSSFEEELLPTLRDTYPQAKFGDSGAAVTPEVARMAVIDALTEEKRKDSLLDMAAKGASPDLLDALLGKEFGIEGLSGFKESMTSEDGKKSPERTLAEEAYVLAQKISGQRTPSAASIQEAGRLLRAEKEALERQYEGLETSSKQANNLRTVASRIQDAVGRAGYTGVGREFAQPLLGLGGVLSGSSKDAFQAGEDLSALSVEAVKDFGPSFKGPMSDRDVALMLKGYVGIDKSPEFNLKAAKMMERSAMMQDLYTDYMDEMKRQGKTATEANRNYELLRRKVPLVNAAKDGLNEFWESGKAFEMLKSGVDAPSLAVPETSPTATSSLPEGAVDTGRTSKGRPVYKLPDGRLVRG